MRFVLLFSFLLIITNSAHSSDNKLNSPWYSFITKDAKTPMIQGVATKANVSVSDGLKYDTVTFFDTVDKTVFKMTYPDRTITMGREGFWYWSHNGQKQSALKPEMREFILGHQYHAFLMIPDTFDLKSAPIINDGTWQATDIDDNIITVTFDQNTKQPLRMTTKYKRHGLVSVELKNWENQNGYTLPTQLIITHGDRVFTYDYKEINLSPDYADFNKYTLSMDKLTDEQQLLRLHRDMIDAHKYSDGSLMAHIWADDITIVNRGKLLSATGDASSKRMTSYLSSVEHYVYHDRIKPKVTISTDGKMGWVAVEVYAEGMNKSTKQPFDFVSAWIATFTKENGVWKMTANASNFAP